jgi:hypothetical protein
MQPLVCLVCGSFIGCGSSPANGGLGSAAEGPVDAATNRGSAGESGATPIEPSGEDATTDANAGNPSFGTPAPLPSDDGAAPLLWIADAAPVRSSECKPGTYSGTFVMMVGGLVGGGLTLMGNLSITLVADKPSSQFGEFNSGILTVAPGAMFAAKDNLGDELFANISGQLDCGTRMFVGTLSNGGYYVFGNDAASGVLDGSMSATYDASASPPALGNGSFMFSSPNVPLTTGMGTWSATLQ